MEQYLLQITAMRRVTPDEVQVLLVHAQENKKGRIWLLGLKGSRRLVEDVATYKPDQWKLAAEKGLVYLEWTDVWAFAPDLDEHTGLPLLMQRYEKAFEQQVPVEQVKLPLEEDTANTSPQ